MSMDAGGLAHMTYNNSNTNNNNNAFSSTGLGAPGSGYGGRGSRINSKRLSVALPPKVGSINENSADVPTPRTSRSHLLAGLRTQPKTPAVPASAPYSQTQHQTQGIGGSQWAGNQYNAYGQGIPQTATGAGFDQSAQYAMNAAQQMYSLPEQVLAPPSMYDESMDPGTLQQLQMTSLFLAQRQQQLQQKLAALSFQGQGQYQQGHMQTPQNVYGQQQQQQQQFQSPIEVQPGVYLVYNPALQSYTYAIDQTAQQQAQAMGLPQQAQAQTYSQMPAAYEPPTPSFNVSPPPTEKIRSFTPPKKAPSPPSALEHVEPLPPPSATAFRRGHKKASSLAINPFAAAADGPKTSSAASFGTQRSVFPPAPMTGTFGPGNARAGEHPLRQPRGPPPLEELTAAPTSKHENSKNFATRQRRRALDSLMKAGTFRRGVSRSSGGSPVSEAEYNFSIEDTADDHISSPSSATVSRKMSPIGSEMQEKRSSKGSQDGYFGLSSASSSECEDASFKAPPTPATPVGGERRKMMLGVLNAAEKRKSTLY